jgi:hypothetical protein
MKEAIKQFCIEMTLLKQELQEFQELLKELHVTVSALQVKVQPSPPKWHPEDFDSFQAARKREYNSEPCQSDSFSARFTLSTTFSPSVMFAFSREAISLSRVPGATACARYLCRSQSAIRQIQSPGDRGRQH